jgi:hypothetical protein
MSVFQTHLLQLIREITYTFDLILDILDLLPFNVSDLDWLQRLFERLSSIYMFSRHSIDSAHQIHTLNKLSEIGSLAKSILNDYLSLSLDGGGSIRFF